MRIGQSVAVFALTAFAVLELGSQSVQPVITITNIPAWGQDGSLSGIVSGVGSQTMALYLFAFVPDVGWMELPGTCQPVTNQAGQFAVGTGASVLYRYATRFTAYLTPANVPLDCTSPNTIPFSIQHNSLASVSYPRLPQLTTLSFAGMRWYIKDAPVPVSPGPQWFVKDNAYVDSFGQLHLRVSRCGNSWCAAEVYTTDAVGYGTYRFNINSQLSNLDPNMTLGLFTWDAQAPDQNYQEWDIEFSRWGIPSAAANAQFVVQPYNGPNNIYRFLMSASSPSSHAVTWVPNQVGFVSTNAINTVIGQWMFTAGMSRAPTPGDVHLHLNFYVGAGQAPSVPTTQEIVVASLQYIPFGPQLGFSRSVDNIPFNGNTYSVPLASTGSACSAQVESDSPWISVIGSRIVPAGTPVQYSVSDNVSTSRSGSLILQSTSCNPAPGAQVLAVTQAGLVCAPTFAAPSSHVGFIPSIFPVAIKGTASACTWSVNASAPWLQLVSGASGAGDGTVQVSTQGNADPAMRGAVLSLNNGPTHSVYQDGMNTLLALSPLSAPGCGQSSAQFGLSWSAPSSVEFHLNTPDGPLAGQFGPTGTTTLPGIPDGTLIFMLQSAGGSQSPSLASARASVTSSNCGNAAIAPLGLVNAASFSAASLAPDSLATVFGTNLSSTTAQAGGNPYPTSLGGASVSLAGQACPLWYASGGQINFAVPSNLPVGRHILATGGAVSDVLITSVSPGIFTLKGDGTGVPLAAISGIAADGSVVTLAPYQCSASSCSATAMTLPAGLNDLYIVLYGTGIRHYRTISAKLGSALPEVLFVGAQGQFPGLDQVNLHLRGPFTSLTGSQTLRLQVDGISSNPVSLQFQ